MSGFPVLMLMLASGLTYGWKPDGDGGVEYVVQIPAEQLSQLERNGSISSVIDPAVRGHVSRIVIQVGDGPLPKNTPPALSLDAAVSLNSEDHAAIPIPEMDSGAAATPIAGLAASRLNQTSETASVMKPQAGGNPPSGLGLPPSLAGAAAGGNPEANSPGRSADTASSPATRNIVPPPATRSPPADNNARRSSEATIPDFTGGNNGLRAELATPRAGGPTTEPTTARDRDWTIPGAEANRTNLPTTSPVTSNPSDSPFRQSRSTAATANTADNSRANLGLSANESFGRAPGNVSLPQPQWAQQTQQTQQTRSTLNTVQQSPLQQNTLQQNSIRQNPAQATTGQPRSSQGSLYGADPSAAQSAGSPYDRGATAPIPTRPIANAPSAAGGAQSASSNARGDFFVDAYGNPVDRDGRPLGGTGDAGNGQMPVGTSSPYSGGLAERQDPYGRGRSFPEGSVDAYGRPVATPNEYERYAQQVAADPRSPSDAAIAAAADRRRAAAAAAEAEANQRASTPGPEDISARSAGRPTPSERLGQTTAVNSERDRPSQPLLTWLLLISFVGNVYLVFWMKKLLVRYRDLVAAKRMAAANANS